MIRNMDRRLACQWLRNSQRKLTVVICLFVTYLGIHNSLLDPIDQDTRSRRDYSSKQWQIDTETRDVIRISSAPSVQLTRLHDVIDVSVNPIVSPAGITIEESEGSGEVAVEAGASSEWEAKQAERRALIQKTCSSVKHSGKFSAVPTSSKIYVDRKHKVLYCAIPKAACSSWKVALATLTGNFNASDHQQTLQVHDEAFMASIGLNQLRSYSRSTILKIINTYNKILVVRHPYERLISAFVDKFERFNHWTEYFQHKFGREAMSLYRENPTKRELETGRNITFTEFVRLITDSSVNRKVRINEHWDTFQSLCMPCVIPYDYVINYETMEEDNFMVLRELFGVEDPQTIFPHANPNPGVASQRTISYMKQLNQTFIEKLAVNYNMDLEMFNYSWVS